MANCPVFVLVVGYVLVFGFKSSMCCEGLLGCFIVAGLVGLCFLVVLICLCIQ